MHAAIKAQWLTALRSGEYEQGAGYLNNDGKFCCLGVLCDLAERAGVVEAINPPKDYPEDPAWQAVAYGDHGAIATLPEAVRDWAGLSSFVGELRTPIRGSGNICFSEASDLATLNDYFGYDFNKIADVIEEQF